MQPNNTRHRLVAFLAVTMFLFTGKSLSQQADSSKPLPPLQYGRQRKADIKHIAIDLRFDWKKKKAHGTAIITLAPYNVSNTILLDAGMLTINSVTFLNGSALKFNYDGGDKNDGLEILLDRVYPPGKDLSVKINYSTNWINTIDPNNLSGSNGKGLRFSAPTSNDPNKPKEIWSMGEPESNRYWFPCYDSPNDLLTTEFTATVDGKLIAISNGRLVGTKNNADGTRSFHWKMDTPHANYLTSFVIGEYADVKQNYNGITLHNFSYPKEIEATTASVERLPDMVKFFSELTGVKYPYTDYKQVFVQDMPWGTASAGIATQTENMVDDHRTHVDFLYLWDGLEAEALAHQWFGSYLACRDWSDTWLSRGFAHYFDGLYNEYKNGHEEFLLWQIRGDNATYLGDWNSGYRRPVITKQYEDIATITGDNYSYTRGALVLHMLRKHLGEDNWRKAIRHYTRSNANRLISTADLRNAIEESTGESIEWFFDQWLYKMGHPVFQVTKKYDDIKKQLILTVRQTQKRDTASMYPQVDFFKGKVTIEIDQRIEEVWLDSKAENVFTFSSSQQPKLVNFDYENTWIKETRFDKSLEELLYQLQNDKDILGKSWAMTELVNLAKKENTATTDKETIYAALRSVILSKTYWRLRLGAIWQLRGLLTAAQGTNSLVLDDNTIATLLAVIKNDHALNRAAAINFLGMTADPKFAGIYLTALTDQSDRVISSAAFALGKSKSPDAFNALAKLVSKPSWKNQSLMSALNGLKELGDPRGFDIAFKALSDLKLLRWRLPVPPVWDLRIFAAETITALGKSKAAYPLIFERFKRSLEESDTEGVFNNIILMIKLADPQAQEAFEILKQKFKEDINAMTAVDYYEGQFKEAINKH